MKHSTASLALCSAVAFAAVDGVPEWVHLLPAGEVRTVDGRGPYTVASMAALITASFQGADKLPLDENHATDKGAALGLPAPAMGWIVALEARDDGLWGKVEWTPGGRQLMEDKAYSGISPVILHDAKGRVARLLRASLTNTPNLEGLMALHSQEAGSDAHKGEPGDGTGGKVRAAIARLRAAGMSLEDISRALAAIGGDASRSAGTLSAIINNEIHNPPETLLAALEMLGRKASKNGLTSLHSEDSTMDWKAKLIELLGLDSNADDAAILAALQREMGDDTVAPQSQNLLDNPTVMALQTQLVEQASYIAALTEGQARRDAVAFVDGAIQEGRVGVKPMRDDYIALHMQDRARAEKLIGGMPRVSGSTPAGMVIEDAGDRGLRPEDRQVMALFGMSEADYQAELKSAGLHKEVL